MSGHRSAGNGGQDLAGPPEPETSTPPAELATPTRQQPRPTARRWAVRAGLLVVTWAGLTGVLVAVGEVVVHSSAIQEVDRDVMSLVVEHRTPVLNTVMQVVTWFGSWMAVAAAAIVVVVLVVRRQLPTVAVPLAVVAWAGEISGVTLAKNIVQRSRPPERVWVVTAHGWSWPSGHAAAACLVFTCLAAVVALLTPDHEAQSGRGDHGRGRCRRRRRLTGRARGALDDRRDRRGHLHGLLAARPGRAGRGRLAAIAGQGWAARTGRFAPTPRRGREPEGEGVAERGSGLARWVPGVRAAQTYERRWARPDLVAGIVLAAILVPQGMAYAELAGLPPVTGLYTTIGCLVGYAVFGPSRILVLGPDSSVSPMIFAAITPLLAGGDMTRAITLAGMLAIIVALIEIGLALAKLGFVADLLSNEVQVGYMNGLAVVIIVGQLPKLFGFSTDADGFVDELRAFFSGLDKTVAASLLVGVGVLVILLVLPRFTRRVPAVLVGIVAATVVSALADLHAHGVRTVGTLPKGVPTPSLPWTKLADAGPLLVAAVGITLVSLADTIATSSSFGARRGEEVDPNQEMIGIGAANVAAGFLQGFAVSTSGSRTVVVEQAGAKSQLSSLVGAGVVAVLLIFLNSLLADLPQSALAAVLIAAALSLMDLRMLVRYYRVRKSALALSLIATLGVVFLGVLQGIVIAVGLAVLLFFRRSWQPHGAVLGYVEHLDGWHNVARYPGAQELPGIVVYRWEAPLFFANCTAFRNQVRRIVRDRQPTWVVVQCEAITDLDVSAAEMLEQLDTELNRAGMHMAFVEMRSRLQELVLRYGLFKTLDRERFYPTLDAGLAAIQAS